MSRRLRAHALAAALALAVLGLLLALDGVLASSSATYTVIHVTVDGPRDSEQAIKDAAKSPSGVSSGRHEVVLDADATNAEILAAADALSTHSVTTNSRYIDASGEVHNFRSGARTYWLITKSEVNVGEPEPDTGSQNVGLQNIGPQDVGANQLTLTGAIADQELVKGESYPARPPSRRRQALMGPSPTRWPTCPAALR